MFESSKWSLCVSRECSFQFICLWQCPGEVWTMSTHPIDTQQQTKAKIPLNSSLANQRIPRGYLQEHGWLKRQPHHQKLTPAGVTVHKSWNPGALCMASRKPSMLECLLSSVALTVYITSGREELVNQLCFRNFLRLVRCFFFLSLNIRGNCPTIRTVVLPETLSCTRFLALAQAVSLSSSDSNSINSCKRKIRNAYITWHVIMWFLTLGI